MSIEHDEKMPRLSTYSLLSFSTPSLSTRQPLFFVRFSARNL